MVVGAMGGALTLNNFDAAYKDGSVSAFVVVLSVICVSILAGMLYSCLLGIACINFKADQTLVGTAMNMLSVAIATVVVRSINQAADASNNSFIVKYTTSIDSLRVKIGSFEFNWFMLVAVIALVVAYVLLYKTKFGLRLMACGEHPQAADSVGINVNRMRWAGVLISGVFGGLGGIVFVTSGSSQWQFENGVVGFGFLSLAVMIFGQWKPHIIALAALLFGFFRALSNVYVGFDFLQNLNIPSTFYNMLPYVVSLIVLGFTSKNSRAPKAEGIPYDKSTR
jgi:simple sugar transport system permease protein